jgi:hypothetical protein
LAAVLPPPRLRGVVQKVGRYSVPNRATAGLLY